MGIDLYLNVSLVSNMYNIVEVHGKFFAKDLCDICVFINLN